MKNWKFIYVFNYFKPWSYFEEQLIPVTKKSFEQSNVKQDLPISEMRNSLAFGLSCVCIHII